MRRLTPLIVLVAFVFSCGGEWSVLQGIAWIKMIHDYSQMVPFTEAVSMTVSGKFPCPICKALAEKKQAENDKLGAFAKYEKKFFPPLEIALIRPQSNAISHLTRTPTLSTRTDAPPTPPPRLVLG